MGNRALLFAHPLFDAGHLVILILNSLLQVCVGNFGVQGDDGGTGLMADHGLVHSGQGFQRLKAYHEQTEPLVAFYRERGKLAVIPFCPSIEETTAEVMKALEA